MKKILFKGKRLANGEWVEGSLINNAFYHYETKEPVMYIFAPGENFDGWENMEDETDIFEVDPETVEAVAQ